MTMEKPTISDQVTPANTSHDAERKAELRIDHNVDDLPDDKANLSGRDSSEFQGGVQRVRAITSAWSTKTLILMFIL